MERMVINCFINGSVQFTLCDSFLNPAPDQRREIERMSSVKFNENIQKFFIEWIKGPHAGMLEMQQDEEDGSFYQPVFDTYEQAVSHEINRANEMRLEGHKF